jgi:hypothetical protein
MVKGMSGQNEMSDTDRIINRHIARLLTELEDAGCPVIFRDAVKSKLAWMRSDLNEMNEEQRNDQHSPTRR